MVSTKKYQRSLTAAQRSAAVAKIHIAKNQLSMDEETYRAMLNSVAGVRSSKDLTPAGLDKVIAHLKQAGAQFTQPKHAGRVPHNLHSQADKARKTKKIGALLADMQLSWAYATGIAQQMYRKQAVEFCSGDELTGVITALVKKQQKENP